MTISGIRFRADQGVLVLQIEEIGKTYYAGERTVTWRDAKVEDMLDIMPFVNGAAAKQMEMLADRVNCLHQDVLRRERITDGNP